MHVKGRHKLRSRAIPCTSCQPAYSTTSWPMLADGTDCGRGQICRSGQCQAGCLVSSKFYADGASDPSNACKACSAATSTSSFSPVADGTPNCGSVQLCRGGACQAGCWINSVFYAPGTANPNSTCASCQPSVNVFDWANSTEGSACGDGVVCQAGLCQGGCFIDGTFYYDQATSPNDSCLVCDRTKSASSWSKAATLTSTAKIPIPFDTGFTYELDFFGARGLAVRVDGALAIVPEALSTPGCEP